MKELYEIGESPALGDVPRKMFASLIRPERYGRPETAFRTEVVDVPDVEPGQVLVQVMAAGINYNNVWAALGHPLDVVRSRQRRGAPEDFHIGGSEGSGIVWKTGEGVRGVVVGDHVILSGCTWDEQAEEIRLGADPMTSPTQRVWGYEDNWGSFAQYALVEEYQCHPKPRGTTWEQAAAFLLTGATAYRQLFGWAPHTVRPGDPVLVWGGAGGLGTMAIQLTALWGGRPVAVVSDDERAELCRRLGAVGTIDRRQFSHWGRLPDIDDDAAMRTWLDGARAFGAAFWKALGEKRSPYVVLEHTGEDTIPTSLYVCDHAGMVVICGGTTGYNADVDLRFLWMRQKRLQGSHFANLRQCREVSALVEAGRLDPCLSWTGTFDQVGEAHQMMYTNSHPGGNMAVLVNAREPGLGDLAR